MQSSDRNLVNACSQWEESVKKSGKVRKADFTMLSVELGGSICRNLKSIGYEF